MIPLGPKFREIDFEAGHGNVSPFGAFERIYTL